jgi:hypothetical protein
MIQTSDESTFDHHTLGDSLGTLLTRPDFGAAGTETVKALGCPVAAHRM